MKETLIQVDLKLEAIKQQLEALKTDMENIRSYYKYQNDETRSISEDFIVTYSNMGDIQCLQDLIEELLIIETEDEE